MLYADYDVAIDLARRAQALATRFGATDALSDALNTQAASRSAQGLDWAAQMREALDIALAGGHHHEAGRAYTNLSGIHAGNREFAEAERYLEPGIAFCDEHDITTFAICLRGEHANVLERTSRWDEAVALSTEILIKVGPSPANRLCSLIRLGVIGSGGASPGSGSTSMRQPPRRTRPASRRTRYRPGWPAPRRTGSKATRTRPGVRPSWPTTCVRPPTPGFAAPSQSGCAASAHRA